MLLFNFYKEPDKNRIIGTSLIGGGIIGTATTVNSTLPGVLGVEVINRKKFLKNLDKIESSRENRLRNILKNLDESLKNEIQKTNTVIDNWKNKSDARAKEIISLPELKNDPLENAAKKHLKYGEREVKILKGRLSNLNTDNNEKISKTLSNIVKRRNRLKVLSPPTRELKDSFSIINNINREIKTTNSSIKNNAVHLNNYKKSLPSTKYLGGYNSKIEILKDTLLNRGKGNLLSGLRTSITETYSNRVSRNSALRNIALLGLGVGLSGLLVKKGIEKIQNKDIEVKAHNRKRNGKVSLVKKYIYRNDKQRVR